jgi:phenylacetate-CoA ligase
MDFGALLARKVIAPVWLRKDWKRTFSVLEGLEQTQFHTSEEIEKHQIDKLRRIVRYANTYCPFYQERFAQTNLDVESAFPLEAFRRIPPLTKEEVRHHGARLTARGFPAEKLFPKQTGGSTSVPLQFYIDTDSNGRKNACTWRHNRWAGWDIGDKTAMVWGAMNFRSDWNTWLRNLLMYRSIALDTLRLDPEMMHAFARQMQSFRPKVVFGHSHSVYILAVFLQRYGYPTPSVNTVVSTSTVLTETERALIESVFQCEVFDRYGCEEVSLIASECERHTGLHLNSDHLLVEFLVDGRPAAPGECGEIHVTDLTNFAMPFIRYRVEDAGTPTDRLCPCGRGLPLMEKVQGRVADFIVTPEGRVIFGVSILDNFTAKFTSLERVQIVQDRIDHLLFRIVRGEGFSEPSFTAFRAAIPEFFGPSMKSDFDFVDEIPRERSGKYRFTISHVPNPFEKAEERAPAASAPEAIAPIVRAGG